MISKLYYRAINWWTSLPWYWKLLGFSLLVGIFLLGILSKLTGKHYLEDSLPYSDLEVGNPDKTLEDLKETASQLKIVIEAKQKDIATKLESAAENDGEALERLIKLSAAKTMEELDELQLEWDL